MNHSTALHHQRRLPCVEISQFLNKSAWQALIVGEIDVLRLPNYFPYQHCLNVATRLRDSPDFRHYVNAPDIGCIGHSFYDTVGRESKAKTSYLDQANISRNLVNQLFAPLFNPLERFVADIEQIHYPGVILQQIHGRPMFSGLARVFATGSEALPHCDFLEWDDPTVRNFDGRIRRQLAWNVYLDPADGGELEIWRLQPSQEQYDVLKKANSYGLDRKNLPLPDLAIRPSLGEAVIFDSRNVHAVSRVMQGARVTLSTFFAFRGTHKPITRWS